MDKHTNPFHAFAEAISIFAALGENPMQSGATYTEAKPGWTEEVLSIMVNREYEGGASHYYVVEVHLMEEGFKKLTHNFGREEALTVAKESHDKTYTKLSVELSPRFRIFCLVPKGSDTEVVL